MKRGKKTDRKVASCLPASEKILLKPTSHLSNRIRGEGKEIKERTKKTYFYYYCYCYHYHPHNKVNEGTEGNTVQSRLVVLRENLGIIIIILNVVASQSIAKREKKERKE